MSKKDAPLRSDLSKAKGLGSAHHGVSHWWLQRVTAIAIAPLALWFISSLIGSMLSSNVIKVAEWLASPVNALVMVLLLLATFVHAKLGMQVIIEDYVHGPVKKYTLLLGLTFICYGAAALGIMSVLKLHLLDVMSAAL